MSVLHLRGGSMIWLRGGPVKLAERELGPSLGGPESELPDAAVEPEPADAEVQEALARLPRKLTTTSQIRGGRELDSPQRSPTSLTTRSTLASHPDVGVRERDSCIVFP